MKISLHKLLLVIVAVTLLGCGQKKETNEDTEVVDRELPAEERSEKALYDEVMKIHDEAMPKMDFMMSLKGDLLRSLDSLREKDPSADYSKLERGISQLEKADEAMMQWMRDFEPQAGGEKSHEEILKYYNEQKELITDVHEQMKASIANAKELNN